MAAPHATKSKNNCCVPQCSSTYKDHVSMHKFPKANRFLLEKWIVALKMGKKISPCMMVCSLHFKDDDFFLKENINQRARLRKTAIPSQRLPIRQHDCTKNLVLADQRRQRAEKRSEAHVACSSTEMVENGTSMEPQIEEGNVDTDGVAADLLHFSKTAVVFKKTFEDKGTQCNTYEEFGTYNVSTLVDTDYKCRVLTGVVNMAFFATLVSIVSKICSKKSNLSSKEQVLLTFMKIKLDLSFNSLAVLFKISAKSASLYFRTTIKQLSVVCKGLIRFPPKEEILNNIPICFEQFKSTRIVLDCTEIAIEKSKCLTCRIKSYSYYKKRHTLKYLIGVTPSGMISFLSKGYGGRASDKAIFNKEGLIAKLEPGDAIMADKGVLIETECNQSFVKLIQPPFLRKQKQFSKSDAIRTASIARARVHVERAIQRIKIFKICKGTVQWSILPYMDDIMTVIVGITTQSPPILADNKFL